MNTIIEPEVKLFTRDFRGTPIRMREDGGQLWFALYGVLRLAGVKLDEAQRRDLLHYLGNPSASAVHGPDCVSCAYWGGREWHQCVELPGGKWLHMVTATGIRTAFHHLYESGLYDACTIEPPYDSDLPIGWWAEELEDELAPFGPYGMGANEEPAPGYITPGWPHGYGVVLPLQRPAGPECESPAEQKFWDAYVALEPPALAGLVKQHPVAGKYNDYRLDFALPHLKIGIEIDGWEWHGKDRGRFDRDRKRWRDIEGAGWRLIRYSGKEAHYAPMVCVEDAAEHVAAELKRRKAS